MRLRSLLLPATLLLTLFAGTAAAQPGLPLHPPSGPVERADGPQRPERPQRFEQRRPGQPGQPQARRHRLPPRLRAMIVARFDRNGDGRLTGREKARAKRFVMRHRMQRRQHQGS